MKKSKITKEEWNKRNLTDILNEHDIGDLMDYLVEFRLPELDPNYAAKKEDSGEPVQAGITPRVAASHMGKNFG